jgi:hypothetical protein
VTSRGAFREFPCMKHILPLLAALLLAPLALIADDYAGEEL